MVSTTGAIYGSQHPERQEQSCIGSGLDFLVCSTGQQGQQEDTSQACAWECLTVHSASGIRPRHGQASPLTTMTARRAAACLRGGQWFQEMLEFLRIRVAMGSPRSDKSSLLISLIPVNYPHCFIKKGSSDPTERVPTGSSTGGTHSIES